MEKTQGFWGALSAPEALGRPQLYTDGRAQSSWSCFSDSGISTDRQLIIHGREAKTSATTHLEAESSDQKQIRNGHSPYQSSVLV